MAAIKVTLFAIAAIFLFALPAKQVDAQKCKTVLNSDINWAKNVVDYIIAYNISASKAEQTCYDIVDTYKGPTDDTGSFNYKINGVAVQRVANMNANPDNTGSIVFQDAPDQIGTAYGEQRPNGILVFYICFGSQESTLVAYKSDQPQLASVADDVAKELTDKNLADFKISRDGC